MRVVMICSNARLAQVTLGCLRANGIKPLLIGNRDTTRSLLMSRLKNRSAAGIDFNRGGAKAAAAAIDKMDRQSPLDLVIASDVQSSLLVNEIRSEIRPPIFPIPDSATLDLLGDKRSFHDLARSLGLRTPATLSFSGPAQVDPGHVAREIGYPLVVKPTGRWASIGLCVAQTEADLRKHLREAQSLEGGLVIQQFIPGVDIGLGAFARGGRTLAACTFRCDPRDGAEFIAYPALLEAGTRLLQETRYDGVANFDARLDAEGRIWLLECNPRFFMRMRAARFCGIDFVAMGLPGAAAPRRAARGSFHPPAEIVTPTGFRRVVSGRWPLGQLARSLTEIVVDPLPHLARHLGYDPVET